MEKQRELLNKPSQQKNKLLLNQKIKSVQSKFSETCSNRLSQRKLDTLQRFSKQIRQIIQPTK